MADADLFMECEEEELEPWQQMNDDVEDEEVSIVDSKDSTGTYSLATTPPAVSSGAVSGFTATQMTTSSAIPSSDTKTVPVLAPVSSMLPPTVVQAAVPSLVSPGLPKAAPAQQLILTQSPGSMGTVAVPQVLQPVQVVPSAVPGTSAATNQPIFITTQGFPVRSTRPIQNPVNPLGIVLNVQQGQTVRPITLVSAPGTQFFKPAMGVQQVVSQPAHIRPGAPAVARPPTSNYTTVQIPATLTIRSSTPLTQQGVTTFANMAASTVTQPVHSSVLAQPPQAKVGFQALATGGSRRILMQGGRVLDVQEGDRANLCKVMPEKPGEPEVQKLGNVVNVVTSPTTGKPQSLQIVVSQASSNGLNATVPAVTSKSPLDSIKVGPATSIPDSKICPRCGAEFRMIEALRGHMCLTQDLSDTKSPQSKSLSGSTVTHSALSLPPQPKPQPSQKAITPPVSILEGPSSGTNSESKLIMLVDDFYYGCHEGNCTQTPQDTLREPMLFKCLSCSKKLKNNIRLMNHMKHHVELEQQSGEVDTHTYCQHCYRQFPTPFQLQCHLESVHSHYESSTKCKICEWAFESEPVFLQHMKNTHKPGEMPYVCQVCDYRSSFYLDVYNHFRTWHEDTRHLLCLYCLKVFKNSNSYQQHFIRHQKKSVYHCNKCRLQFLFTKDKIEHKLNHHKTFRKPEQLEGLQPGTKVTIRAYAVQNRTTGMVPVIPPGAHIPPDRDTPSPHVGEVTHHQTHNGNKQNQPHPPVKKKSVSKMLELLTKFQEQREMVGKQTCLECNFDVPDFPNHYPTYVHCSLCRYSTCCSRAYANHMINNHIPRKSTKYLALYRKPVPSWMKMTCVTCKYTTQVGDLMAKHLAQNLSHCYSLCTPKECLESDIECSEVEEEEEEEPKREAGIEGGKPDWATLDSWGKPEQSTEVQEFTASCGPQHSLSKNADAIDYFHLLFPRALLQVFVQETNAFAVYSQAMGQGDQDWSPVNIEEIQGFLGLSILIGLQSLPEINMYWSLQHYDSCDTFLRTMTPRRFQQIATHIRGGGYATDQQEYPDKLHMIRPMLNIMNSAMWKIYKPNKCLTIDRAILPSLEAEGGKEKQNPCMPQVWLLCDSKSGYCHRLIIQTEHGGQKNCRELGIKVVLPLVEGLQGKHHQVFLANSLMSVPLVMELLQWDIYCSSSFPPQVPIFPENFWEKWEQSPLNQPGDFFQYQFGLLLATRWKDSKEMCCLSTNAKPGLPDTVWRKSHLKAGELYPIKRPQAFQLLQENMRGVDICNQLQAYNPMGGLTRDTRWRCLFWFLLNLTIVNSFIVLRETRKDSPPPWVEDGRFSQAFYRKRLGVQLAKCAQKGIRPHSGEERQEAGTAPTEKGGEAGGARKIGLRLRHRLVKISTKPKRCKNCSLKNLRHASVFGCVICRVNLCKGSRCFWEFHDLSPHNKGSPKVGFVMESPRYKLPQNESGSSCQPSTRLAFPAMHLDSAFQSNQTMMSKEPCQEMETVEDKGLGKDGETEAVPQKVQEDTNMKEISRSVEPKTVSSLPSVATAKFVTDATGTLKEREETLSVRQLRIVLFALCCGISQAAEHFNTQPQLIEAWLLEKKRQIHREGCTTAGVSGEAVDRLVEWVLAQREQQLPVNEKNLFQKASEIHSQANQSSSFRISYEWAVGFMLQHDLGLQVTDTVSRHLPCNAEENAQAFTEFVHKQIEIQSFSPSVICAMDELSVFIDLDVLANPLSVGKEFAFQLVGTGESLCDIFLAMLADGTVLPTMVFFKGQLPGRLRIGLPDSVLLEAKVEGFSEEEELELWISQVWQKHVNSQGGNKAMLILDSFRSHMLEDSLAAISAVNTLPTVIPIGCTCRLQPLEMCLKPVLQHFLQARWTQLASQGGAAGASPKDLVQLLVAWLVESLATFAAQPKLLQRSFHVAQVYPFTEEEQSPADAQKELILTLTEVLMGPERLGPKSATPKETVEKQGTDKDKMKLSDDRKVVGDQGSTNTIKEAKDEKGGMTKPKNVGVHGKKNVLGKSEFSAMSPSHMPTANPQVLHQIFDKDSDAESFHGFDDTEIYAEINS
ncbi:pogo transposable element with ZNF domain-like [Scleropages formosus]|uniref:Pogo transposable element with ZNF domain-like n=1 Tax=Scleropages formosus TaxID=113540 RepID=A0A0P7YYC7_SCLFO|nr:pogo transposable element with ZNF domain-like [Scleropages formosus]